MERLEDGQTARTWKQRAFSERRKAQQLRDALEGVLEFAGQFRRFHTGFVHIIRMVDAALVAVDKEGF